ncbi:MAG: hypothetical protein CSA53_00730 [Gammaproteobacteria bacterium]|nr:MAG: hypothetical protein CSA53_00730 [Gammaproteobacteria bacterium]
MGLRVLVLVVAMILVANPAKAWWDLGHRAVCDVALETVNAKTRVAVEQLLAPGERFGAACIWADAIKSERPETAPWHYINTKPGDTDLSQVHRSAEGDILTALQEQIDILSDCARSPAQRREALRFVGHLVGDIHQPLHVAYQEDLGGNLYRVNLPPALAASLGEEGGTSNMHAVWDGLLLVYASRDRRQSLYQLLQSHPADGDVSAEPETWANESLALVNDPALAYLKELRVNTLTEAYFQQNWPKAVRRLSAAAQRLAYVLQQSLQSCGSSR